MPPLRFLTAPEAAAPQHRFGYLGSANPWNAASVAALEAAFGDRPLPWLIAGRILRRPELLLPSNPVRMPEVADVAGFYDAVDCVLNPMTGGTGLKIKTVEALAYGRPVLGTRDAFAGLPAEHPGHSAPDAPAMVALMREYLASVAFRHGLRRASRLLALRYAAEVAAAHDALAARLHRL
nr:glycosyltransferase family 4 protein [Siccirubricoccus soli]